MSTTQYLSGLPPATPADPPCSLNRSYTRMHTLALLYRCYSLTVLAHAPGVTHKESPPLYLQRTESFARRLCPLAAATATQLPPLQSNNAPHTCTHESRVHVSLCHAW
eukprot:GHVU01075027.1.p1 GENE.GHVU01075027.1~~GHVU01075027.1.p1  ORF type:complete len:108 (-),score=2.18 GHVU01075027.1:402-725(-)